MKYLLITVSVPQDVLQGTFIMQTTATVFLTVPMDIIMILYQANAQCVQQAARCAMEEEPKSVPSVT